MAAATAKRYGAIGLMASTENKAVVKIQPTNINYSSLTKPETSSSQL
jgi:hypothetical protein